MVTYFLSLCVTHSNAGVGTPLCLQGCGTAYVTCAGLCVATSALFPICISSCVAVSTVCIAGCEFATACFDPSTAITISRNEVLPARDVIKGMQIVVFDEVTHATVKTIVTETKRYYGDFNFVEFTIGQSNLMVTRNHMLLIRRSQTNSTSYILCEAEDAQVGDLIKGISLSFHIEEVMILGKQYFNSNEKIDIQTGRGTLIANDLLIPSICDKRNFTEMETAVEFYQRFRSKHCILCN
jgi:hypothetical protein